MSRLRASIVTSSFGALVSACCADAVCVYEPPVPTTYEAFLDAQAEALCDTVIRCGTSFDSLSYIGLLVLDRRACVESLARNHGLAGVAPGSGRFGYDAAAAESCLVGIRTMSCEAMSAPPACYEAVAGTVPVGGACASSAECEGWAECEQDGVDTCGGVCVAGTPPELQSFASPRPAMLGSLGDACEVGWGEGEGASCAAGLVCVSKDAGVPETLGERFDRSGDQGTCWPVKRLVALAPGDRCEVEREADLTATWDGKIICNPTHLICVSGRCESNGANAGAACAVTDWGDPCGAHGQACLQGTCRSRLADGAPCADDGHCTSGHCGAELTCAPATCG